MGNYAYLNELDDAAEIIPSVRVDTALKFLDDGARVGGYLLIWGSPQQRDLQGEYFTPETELGLDWYEQRPALYHHGLDGSLKAAVIGVIDTLKADETGIWAEAQLDLRQRYVRTIRQLIERGVLGWSSGSLPHLVEIAEDGRIKRWPIVEGSMTPTPAEPRKTTVGAIKSAILALDTSELETTEEPPAEESPASEPSSETLNEEPPRVKTTMNLQQIIEAVLGILLKSKPDWALTDEEKAALVQTVTQEMQAGATPSDAAIEGAALGAVGDKAAELLMGKMKAFFEARETAATQVQNALAASAQKAIQNNAQPRSQAGLFAGVSNGGGQVGTQITEVRDMRFDHLSPEDLVFGAHVIETSKHLTGKSVSEDFLKAAAFKVLKAAEKGHKVYGEYAVKSLMPPGIKADEINSTNLSNFGQNWVGAAYENQIWEAVREAPMYEELLRRGAFQVEVGQGFNSVYIPTEGTDPTWYTLVEQNDLDADEHLPVTPKISTPTAPRRQLTLGGIAARVALTDFLEEDSLFAVLPFYRSRMELSAQEQIEYVLFNGDVDVTASTNINLIDGTPSVDSKGRGPSYLAMDGIFKLPLVTTTGLSRDGGAFDETDFLETWKLLPSAQQINQKALLYVVDPFTYMAALNITAFKTRDVFNPATIESGILKNVYGIDVYRSGQIGKANAAGKISSNSANNTKGRLSIIRPDQWAIGWKRKVRTETARDIDAQATVVVSTLRFGVTYRNASGGAALSFNLTI